MITCYCVAQSQQEAGTSEIVHQDRQDGVHEDKNTGKLLIASYSLLIHRYMYVKEIM